MKHMKWKPRWETGRQTNITELIGALHYNTKAFHPFLYGRYNFQLPCYCILLLSSVFTDWLPANNHNPHHITPNNYNTQALCWAGALHYNFLSQLQAGIHSWIHLYLYTILSTPLNTVSFKFTNFTFRYTLSCSWNVCKLCVLFCSKYLQECSLKTVITAI